jgi:hypothetical protein
MMLLQAAANQWNVPVSEVTVSNGVIRHAGSNYAAPIILRAGGEWSGTSRTDRPSVLICRGAARDMTFRLQSGRRYALQKTGAGTLILAGAN